MNDDFYFFSLHPTCAKLHIYRYCGIVKVQNDRTKPNFANAIFVVSPQGFLINIGKYSRQIRSELDYLKLVYVFQLIGCRFLFQIRILHNNLTHFTNVNRSEKSDIFEMVKLIESYRFGGIFKSTKILLDLNIRNECFE